MVNLALHRWLALMLAVACVALGTTLLVEAPESVLAVNDAGSRAIIPPRPTPGTGAASVPVAAGTDDELVVDEIRTDRYPQMSARFSIRPLIGRPPGYLEPRAVTVVVDGVIEPPLEVHTVGRVPTDTLGTYEISWITSSRADAGATISGELAISINSRPEIGTGFSFVRPLPRQAEVAPGESGARALIPVVHPEPGEIDRPLATAMAAIFAGTAFIAVIGGMIGHAHWRRAQDRLTIWVGRSAEHRARAISQGTQSRRTITISPMVRFFGKVGVKLIPTGQGEKIRRSLILAGRPTNQHFTRFVATKAGLGFGLFFGGFWLMVGLAPFTTTILTAATLGIVGFLLPSISLGRTIKKRQAAIKKALPDALDLITIGVSAGLAFDGAIGEIVEKWDNELSQEFSTMLGELRMGAGRRQALLNLADRTQVDEIQIFTSQLIQADELGMSLTDTLLTLANQMRLRRRQRAEELAHKAAVKMLIPLVFLIFPALFIVILGPAVQDLYGFMTNGTGK
jgi:tight adherence protein C